MRFTAALISALVVATGLAAPTPEAKDAAADELNARWKCCKAPIFPLNPALMTC